MNILQNFIYIYGVGLISFFRFSSVLYSERYPCTKKRLPRQTFTKRLLDAYFRTKAVWKSFGNRLTGTFNTKCIYVAIYLVAIARPTKRIRNARFTGFDEIKCFEISIGAVASKMALK